MPTTALLELLNKSSDVTKMFNLENRRSGRIQKNILSKHIFIDNVQPINANYADSGLFGLKLSGSAAHVKIVGYLG